VAVCCTLDKGNKKFYSLLFLPVGFQPEAPSSLGEKCFFDICVFKKLLQEGTIASCISQLLDDGFGCSVLSINESCNQNASLNINAYI